MVFYWCATLQCVENQKSSPIHIKICVPPQNYYSIQKLHNSRIFVQNSIQFDQPEPMLPAKLREDHLLSDNNVIYEHDSIFLPLSMPPHGNLARRTCTYVNAMRVQKLPPSPPQQDPISHINLISYYTMEFVLRTSVSKKGAFLSTLTPIEKFAFPRMVLYKLAGIRTQLMFWTRPMMIKDP